MNALGFLAAGFARLAEVRHLGGRHALEADVDAAHRDGVAIQHVRAAHR